MKSLQDKAREFLEKFERSDAYSQRHIEKAFIAGAEYQKDKMLSGANKGYTDWVRGQIVQFVNHCSFGAWQASRLSALKEIEELKKELKESKELIKEMRNALSFYGKEGNWDDRILLILSDAEDTAYSSYSGGKRARQCLSKNKELIERLIKE